MPRPSPGYGGGGGGNPDGGGWGGGGWGGGGWGAAPEVHELFARQGRGQTQVLMTLDEVHEIAGASLRREYHVALERAAADAAVAAAGGGGGARPPPCAHCGAWPERPLHRGFGADVLEQLPRIVQEAALVAAADTRAVAVQMAVQGVRGETVAGLEG